MARLSKMGTGNGRGIRSATTALALPPRGVEHVMFAVAKPQHRNQLSRPRVHARLEFMKPSSLVMLIAVCGCAQVVCADTSENPKSAPTLVEEIDCLLVDLDSDEFSVRTAAFKRLQELTAHDDAKPLLAESVQRAMVDADISFEVRKQLQRLRRDLPPAELAPTVKTDADTVDQLLAQLADDSFARRLGAESRLRWLLRNADAVGLIYERVKHCAGNVHLSHEQTRTLKKIYESARAAWLDDEARENDPAAPAEKIKHLVEQIPHTDLADQFRLTQEPTAVVELRDLLAIQANIVPIRVAIEFRLAAGDVSAEADRHLNEILELTKPAMVAEFWRSGRHENIQHLLVGVPSVVDNQGTSHFDRIDDQTAHCVSGVNLSEGDYPVGVAFPHPRERNAFFHLINLPTPRRRMAYEYHVKEDEAGRYTALVTRTLDRYLAQRLPLDERDLTMIMQFNPREVSRFAGRYLNTVDDRKVVNQTIAGTTPPTNAVIPRDGPSIHGLLCSWLASKGTQDAVPGLLAAIEKNRLLPPTETSPCRFDRFAALAIAQRDPWPNVDRWLTQMLPRDERMVLGQEQEPELGATAASLLLRRHGGNLDNFDLIACGDGYARRYGLQAYRYGMPDTGEDVADWWKSRQADNATKNAPTEPQETPEVQPNPGDQPRRVKHMPSEADVYNRLQSLPEK